MKFFIYFITLMSFSHFAVSQNSPPAPVYLCNDCGNFQAKADTNALLHIGEDFYIADLKNNEIRGYYGVNNDPGNFNPDAIKGVPKSVDYEVQEIFDSTAEAHATLYKSTAVVNIPTSVAESAWNLPANTSATNAVGNVIFDNLSFMDKIYAYESSVVALLGYLVDVNIVVKVVFSDGSSALYKITGADPDSVKFSYVKGSATDSDANTVADTQNDFIGRFKLNGAAAGHFIDAVHRFGGTVINFRLGCKSGEMTCQIESSNLSCTYTIISC